MTQDKKTEDEMKPRKYLRDFYGVTKPNHDTILGLTVLATELPLGTHNLYTEDAYQKLREENEALRKALELAANNVTWYAEAADGSDVLYTYGYFVQKCQEVIAKYPRETK